MNWRFNLLLACAVALTLSFSRPSMAADDPAPMEDSTCEVLSFSFSTEQQDSEDFSAVAREAIEAKDVERIGRIVWQGGRPSLFSGTPWEGTVRKVEWERKLMYAALNGKNEDIVEAVKMGADVNVVSETENGMTALMFASMCGQYSSVQALLDMGAKPEIYSGIYVKNNYKDSLSPLFLAAESGYSRIVELLLKAGADPNHHEESYVVEWVEGKEQRTLRGGGRSPLTVAQNATIVSLLLKAGSTASVNYMTVSGTTPLASAVDRRDIESVRLLLENGADPFQKDVDGDTALDIARKKK